MVDVRSIDYFGDYKTLRPSLFRESDNLDSLIWTISEVQNKQQEQFLWLSQNILNLDLAEGWHLDFIGSLVGQTRELLDFNTEAYFGFKDSYQGESFGTTLNPSIGGYWNSRSYFNTATSRLLTDEEYRRIIKARVIYNNSDCSPNDLLEVINLISNSKNNSTQMLEHGLVKIKTNDTSGLLSYFVDKIPNEDNILPIAAGVRVILATN